ncbi:hypothetical protein B0H19DRAFT_1082017 [Mycena capillaripes]|nr:hypothetical protein B0H19DRAFT_1082017 [Mycena capillaripes]
MLDSFEFLLVCAEVDSLDAQCEETRRGVVSALNIIGHCAPLRNAYCAVSVKAVVMPDRRFDESAFWRWCLNEDGSKDVQTALGFSAWALIPRFSFLLSARHHNSLKPARIYTGTSPARHDSSSLHFPASRRASRTDVTVDVKMVVQGAERLTQVGFSAGGVVNAAISTEHPLVMFWDVYRNLALSASLQISGRIALSISVLFKTRISKSLMARRRATGLMLIDAARRPPNARCTFRPVVGSKRCNSIPDSYIAIASDNAWP